mgnify:CR=1 FL=1
MEANCIVQHEVERMEPKREDIILGLPDPAACIADRFVSGMGRSDVFGMRDEKRNGKQSILHSIRYCSRHPAGCRHH